MAEKENEKASGGGEGQPAEVNSSPAIPSAPAASTATSVQTVPGLVWHAGRCKPYNPAEHGARFEVRSPNAGFNGEKAGVLFRDGVGFTDDEDLVPWFQSQKYEVAELRGAAAPAKKRK